MFLCWIWLPFGLCICFCEHVNLRLYSKNVSTTWTVFTINSNFHKNVSSFWTRYIIKMMFIYKKQTSSWWKSLLSSAPASSRFLLLSSSLQRWSLNMQVAHIPDCHESEYMWCLWRNFTITFIVYCSWRFLY